MNRLIRFRTKGRTVVVDIKSVLDYLFHFEFATPHETYAEFLVQDLKKRFNQAVESARQEEYESGWRDAKSKKVRKRTWFKCWL